MSDKIESSRRVLERRKFDKKKIKIKNRQENMDVISFSTCAEKLKTTPIDDAAIIISSTDTFSLKSCHRDLAWRATV